MQVYDSTKQLRYGHLMIMTDQDHDGSHIKGLIMNFLHHFYPSLLKVNGFLLEFITPIVKVRQIRLQLQSLRRRHALISLRFCTLELRGHRHDKCCMQFISVGQRCIS